MGISDISHILRTLHKLILNQATRLDEALSRQCKQNSNATFKHQQE